MGRESPTSIENIVHHAFHRVQDDAFEFYNWLLPQKKVPRRNETDATVENWTLGVVDLPYLGETPLEVVLFVGSAIGFRIYLFWRYYFGEDGDRQRESGKLKNGVGKQSIQKDWRNSHQSPPHRPKSGSTGPDHRGGNASTTFTALKSRSRWWPWCWSSRGSDYRTTSRDDRPLQPDAKATQYRSSTDPCLAAFMSIAQEHKSRLRHVQDPEILRRKRLQAIRTKGKALPQGPLGLTEDLLRTKRSSLRETMWDTAAYDSNEP